MNIDKFLKKLQSLDLEVIGHDSEGYFNLSFEKLKYVLSLDDVSAKNYLKGITNEEAKLLERISKDESMFDSFGLPRCQAKNKNGKQCKNIIINIGFYPSEKKMLEIYKNNIIGKDCYCKIHKNKLGE